MKVVVTENQKCFGIEIIAESMEEMGLLVRFGMNTTKELRFCSTLVPTECKTSTAIVIAKHRKSDSYVPKRGRK